MCSAVHNTTQHSTARFQCLPTMTSTTSPPRQSTWCCQGATSPSPVCLVPVSCGRDRPNLDSVPSPSEPTVTVYLYRRLRLPPLAPVLPQSWSLSGLVAVLHFQSPSPSLFRILSTAYPSLPRRPVVPPPVCCPQCVKVQTLSRQIRAEDARLSQIISPRVKHSPVRPPPKCHLPRDPLINRPWSSSNRAAC